MSSNYLWDRSGPPDPEVERLERILGSLGHNGKLETPALPRKTVWSRWPAAIAAGLLVGVAAWQLTLRPGRATTAWELIRVRNSGEVVYTGQVLRTGPSSQATLQADTIGRIDIGPESELRVLESATAHERMHLAHGRIHALIWAPPRRFVVDTASARAIDLGCQYSLEVDAQGNGLVMVETGWVAFQYDGRESFIAAGAACRTRKDRGPETPYFLDASESFRSSLEVFDRSSDAAALRHVLAEARPRDGITLWHLLTRVPAAQRGLVFDRFADLVRPPVQVTRAAVLAKDRRALDLCWNALNLEDADWWREWMREWKP